MTSVIPLILRRMRAPLLVLISAYSVAVLGFTLIPGVDDAGNPWRMSFFHAFYVVSYTGSTIGFGEVPYAFSNAQRLWTMVSIYLTVVSWLYAVGTIISLVRDRAFRAALEESRLRHSVKHLQEPFNLICGYGDTGSLLVRAFTERNRRVVVLDPRPDRIDALSIRELPLHVPALLLDARNPENLVHAGLQSRWCMSLLAVTDDDRANLKVALTSKLLNPTLPVICRAETSEAEANMASFGTDHIINPNHRFADRLSMAIHTPDMHRIHAWLSGVPNLDLPEHPQPPLGTWIICGYGRLGRAVHRALREGGIDTVIIDEEPDTNGCPPGTVKGKGTEAKTLEQAGIAGATALLACTVDDADNLSIIMTARDIKPDIFLVARENRLANKPLYQAAAADIIVEPSYILTSSILSILNTPLLSEFLKLARREPVQCHTELVERIRAVADGKVPESWTIRISQNRAPAIAKALELGERIPLGSIVRDPGNRDQQLSCLPLVLSRNSDCTLLPDAETDLESGDRILFCGSARAFHRMQNNLQNLNALRYVHTGEVRPDGLLWRALARRKKARRDAAMEQADS
ncbi:MAG: NAD-binding protein [Aquisalimonadaceae bacterium]